MKEFKKTLQNDFMSDEINYKPNRKKSMKYGYTRNNQLLTRVNYTRLEYWDEEDFAQHIPSFRSHLQLYKSQFDKGKEDVL